MTGTTLAGVRVEGPRHKPSKIVGHPLANATIPEARSTMIQAFRAAGKSTGEIARIMRCGRRTILNDTKTPPVTVACGDTTDAA